MRRFGIHLLATTIILLAAVSCSEKKSPMHDRFDNIETAIYVAPDSARQMLAEVDTLAITDIADVNAYTLLSRYLDYKTGANITDTTGLDAAISYYREHPHGSRLPLALYVKGITQYNLRDYGTAVSLFLDAEQEATRLNDILLRAFIRRHITELLACTHSGDISIDYANKTYQDFISANQKIYSDWALATLAITYHSAGKYEESIQLAKKVIQIAEQDSNSYLKYDGMRTLATSYLGYQKFDSAKIIYSQMHKEFPERLRAKDFNNWGFACINTGDTDTLNLCISKINELSNERHWSILNKNPENTLQQQINDLQQQCYSQDNFIKQVLQSNVSSSLSEYKTKLYEIEQEKHKSERTLMVVIILSCIVIFIITILFFYYNQKSKNELMKKEMSDKMSIIQDLQETMLQKESKLNEIQNHVFTRFSGEFKMLNELCTIYYENQSSDKNNRILIYEKVMSIINDIKYKTDDILYSDKNNISGWTMTNFKKDFPNLKEKEYRFMSYLILGFKSKSISLFMDDEINNVYVYKNRLKAKILNSKVADVSDYLKYF